jgi:hypothetical protein
MNAADRLTSETVRELISTPGPAITIVLAGNETGDTAIEFKDALNQIRRELEGQKVDAESLLDPIPDAVADFRGETKSKGNVVILRAPSLLRVFRVGRSVQPLARVGQRFEIRTLLEIRNAQKHFYILALSQNRTRLLECTESTSGEIELTGTPVSYAESRHTRKPDHVLDNRVSAGPSMGSGGGVMFGTSSDMDDKDEYVLHFFIDLDKGVSNALRGSSDPLIPAGVEHELALYRRVNTYPHLLEPGVHGAPDGLEAGDLHRRALDLLDQKEAERGSEVPEDFDKRVGTGHASAHIQEIVAAACEGRVSHLYFQQGAAYMGAFDPVRMRVKHTEDPLDSPVDLIDSAAEQTILHGGEAKILPASAMPNGVPVFALMRYPAVAPAESAA